MARSRPARGRCARGAGSGGSMATKARLNIVVIGALSFSCGCRGGAGGGGRAPVVSSATAPAASAPGMPAVGRLPQVSPVLDDARLKDARERERTRDYAGAARSFEQVRQAVTLPPADACAWDFVDGRLL